MTATPPPRLDRDALLAHRPWVRALAVSLTRDAADADDVEQETWLATLGRAPEDLRTPRAWFVTVARNAARKLARGDARRRVREAALPACPSPRSAAELTAEAEAHRRVVAAVLALDDVHREAVLLRYFEGLGVRETAARAGVPLETVRARLRRAREKLREVLAEEQGGRDGWRLALAPLVGLVSPARLGGAAAAVATGGALVASKTVVACAIALLVAGGLWWALGGRDDAAPPGAASETAAETAATAEPRAAKPVDRATPPAPEGTTAPPASPPVRAAEAPRRTAAERLADPVEPIELLDVPWREALGRVGEQSGVRMFLSAAAARVADGAPQVQMSFERALPGRTLLDLLVRTQGLEALVEEDRVIVVPAGRKADAAEEPVAVTAPATPIPTFGIRGRVTDPDGVPVAGASVVRTADDKVLATSDAGGRFESRTRRPFPTVLARAAGRVPSAPVAVPAGSEELVFVLGPLGGTIAVRVTAGGTPVHGAYVRVGAFAEEPIATADGEPAVRKVARGGATAEDGRFVCEGAPPGKVQVVVTAAGYAEVSRDIDVVVGERAELEIALVAKPALRETLEKSRVSFAFRDTRVSDAVAFLSRVSNVNIVVMPDAAGNDAKVTLSATDLPLAQALKDLCDGAGGLTYDLDETNHVVIVSKRKE